MKILFLAAEAAPLTEVSELGQAAGSLSQALAEHGHDVRVALPFSGVIDRAHWSPNLVARVCVPHVDGDLVARVFEVGHRGVRFYLIAGRPVPRTKQIYGASIDVDGPKFVFTSLAALGLCRALDWQPDIVQGHDSPSGPALYWLDTDGRRDPLFQPTATVFTIYGLTRLNPGAGPFLRQ